MSESREYIDGPRAEFAAAVERMKEELAVCRQARSEADLAARHFQAIFDECPLSLWEVDVSAVKERFKALRQSGVQDFRSFFDNHREEVTRCARLARIVDMNKASLDMFGAMSKDQLYEVGRVYAGPTWQAFKNTLATHAQGGTLGDLETMYRDLQGSTRHILLQWSEIPDQREDRVLVSILDITERKRVEQAVQRAKEEWEFTFDAVPDLVAIIDNDYRICRANKAMAARLGMTAQEVVGRFCHDLVHGSDRPPDYCPHLAYLKDGLEHTREVLEERLGGHYMVTVSPVYDSEGGLIGSVHVARDVTETKKSEQEREALIRDLQISKEELERLSLTDGLTGVFNRRYLEAGLEGEWRRAGRENCPLSLVMLDIDFFKLYNDTYGHPAGDECLRRVALAVNDALRRPGDFVARYGGEEFVCVLPRTDSTGAMEVAEILRTRVSDLNIAHSSSPVLDCVTISLGLATVAPGANASIQGLIAAADGALYAAKRAGRNRSRAASERPPNF